MSFLGQTLHTLHKRHQSKCNFPRLLSARIKIHQNLIIFETKNRFLFTFYITHLFSWNFIYFQQKESIKVQIKWNYIWAVESPKFCNLVGSFCQNHIKFQLKSVEELFFMTLNSDPTRGFKYHMRNFVNFHQTTQKFKNFTLMGYFCPKYLEKYSGVIFHDAVMWNLSKPWPCGFKNGLSNWADSLEHSKSEELYIDGLFLLKACNVSARNVTGIVSWYWRVMQNLKENGLVALKTTWWV